MEIGAAARPPRRAASFNHGLSPALPALAAEASALLNLQAVSRSIPSGHEIVREGRPCTAVWLIIEGIALRQRIMRDGQRQILNFLLPGNFAGTTNVCFDNALYTIKALTPTKVAPIPLRRLLDLFDTHPQLAAKIFWSFASEAAIQAERLITVGRRCATERVAHFLLELLVRLQAIGLANETSYRLPLTQEMISDALGLSIPYVNRVLQQLRRDGLVAIRDRTVVIDDVEALSNLADFELGYLRPLPIHEALAPRVRLEVRRQ
jgi:CRP-like cAMP-binding protein